MRLEAILAVVGYAVGTAQIVLVDWYQRRRDHVRQLRLLRAELRRVASMREKFGWTPGQPPPSDAVPMVPKVSDGFVTLVSSIDFYLTDEHDDDNAQEGLLRTLDGMQILRVYHDRIMEIADEARNTDDNDQKRKLRERATAYATGYDTKLKTVMFVVGSSLKDVERRLTEARLLPQLRRTVIRLPKGANPPPVNSDDDPRVSST